MKYTLLKMVQLILSSMDADEINSINDTVLAQQVVDVIETTYNDLVTTHDFPEHEDFIELEPSLDPSRPTLMKIPEGVIRIDYIDYDVTETGETEKRFRRLCKQSRSYMYSLYDTIYTDEPNVYSYDFLVGAETFPVRGYNDRFPEYYSITKNRYIIFDNYDKSEETTLTANRTLCYGKRVPLFERDDDYIPELDPQNFSYFFNEAKSQAFIELKQVQNAKADQRVARAQARLQRNKHVDGGDSFFHTGIPNFGRMGRHSRINRRWWRNT